MSETPLVGGYCNRPDEGLESPELIRVTRVLIIDNTCEV